ncbi:MAG: glycoside hydrolase domain-containing protein [Acidobacteriota bacterium]
MKHFGFVLTVVLSAVAAMPMAAQDSPFRKLDVVASFSRPQTITTPESSVKDLAAISNLSGILYTDRTLLRTDDNGKSWKRLTLPIGSSDSIASVLFETERDGLAVIAGKIATDIRLARTDDGGATWSVQPLELENIAFIEALGETASIRRSGGALALKLRIPTSSNFEGWAVYTSNDDGRSWQFSDKSVEPARDVQSSNEIKRGNWTLQTEGRCEGVKTGCYQVNTLTIDGEERTPPQINELQSAAREAAKAGAAKTPMFALPPGGTTRISLNRGFDKCQAGSIAQMQTWWDNSPMFDSNIYFSGRNRACPSQPVNTAWVNQVTAMGWGLIPTVVGYQSPCTASTTTAKLSYDPATAETQGRGEADIAAADAANIGLTAGSILYYDMERYDPPSPDTLGCRTATVAFLKGWTERIKELGYQSGVYGSPKNAQEDWATMPAASRMDAIWMARWDNVASVWTYVSFPTFPADVWNNHQRIKQWQAPHNETWGGVTFNIDGNISDAPVAGLAIARNKNADFDGDGKTDISVYRPADGLWCVLNSSNSSATFTSFGLATDIITPGDFDGDGKTDRAVFRPSNGTWYTIGKAGVFGSKAFGTDGDIPVAADYNGDGKTDIAVFRPSTGGWYIAYSDSQGSYASGQFGTAGDKPVVGDYDGDGKADVAVWRPSDGVWYVNQSRDGFAALRFGISTDQPAQGDFDGDGKTDFAVFRDGIWYLQQSTAGFAGVNFGLAGDVPVTGDYDGDGKADIAVYRPSNGTWYLLQSTAGFGAATFGISTDRAVPFAYLAQ